LCENSDDRAPVYKFQSIFSRFPPLQARRSEKVRSRCAVFRQFRSFHTVWVKGGGGRRQVDGTAGLPPAPEMPCAPRQLSLVPRAEFSGVSKRFPGDQRVRLIQPSRASLRLGSTRQSSGLLIGLTRVASLPRRPKFSDHSGLMFKRCRFFPRSSHDLGLPNGTYHRRSKL
jgi:hypothetical protein